MLDSGKLTSPAPILDSPIADAGRAKAYPTSLVLYCLGHLVVDLYSASLGVLQPALISAFRLSFTQAGFLGGVLAFSSSVLQPAYGILADRFHSRLFTALAPAMAGIFISSLGWAQGYWWLVAMVFLGGAGMASFHPQAAANATGQVTHNRAQAMAIFICSGTAGFAIGPALFSLSLGTWGLTGCWVAALPGIVLTLVMLSLLPQPLRSTQPRTFNLSPLKIVWKPMVVLFFLVFTRSIIQVTFSQFLPLYLRTQRGFGLQGAGYALAAFMAAATLGGLVGGNLADRFGGRRVVICSTFGTAPILAVFLFGSGVWSMAALLAGGMTLALTNPVNIIMAQRLAPAQSGTVSALMMGFAWGTAGLIFIPLCGRIADHYTLHTAFCGLICIPVVSYFLSLRLPK
jgi:FSR family fosmidomycin resistance protein-like MFS transporter